MIRRPGRNDSANGTTLAVVSTLAMKEKRERERNNYTESISMKVVRRPSIERIPDENSFFPLLLLAYSLCT